jgi:hypothetical protein
MRRGSLRLGIAFGLGTLTAAIMVPAAAASAGRPHYVAEPLARSGCKLTLDRLLGKQPVYVGATYVTARHVSASFSYQRGATTRLEVGSSPSATGPFSPDGSVGITATSSVPMPSSSTPGNRWYQTYLSFGEWRQACPTGVTYLVMAYRFDGGAHVTRVKSAPAARHCLAVAAGTRVVVDKTPAAVFRDAFTAGGFTGWAQTGWSAEASISYTWHVRGHVCGSTRTVPASPVVEAN